ncbi:MAG: hypothetical protein IEMM0008_0099 [bacterium]|nr:MAG: hypothetical protein IEMM0008_0099 [bacterium]
MRIVPSLIAEAINRGNLEHKGQPLESRIALIFGIVGKGIAGYYVTGGKSELHQEEGRVTPGRSDPMESAAEKIPPASVWVRVKW